MCLYPKLIKNPKYKANKKNGGHVPPILDHRVTYVPVGCGNCMECRKQKAREWNIRLLEEIKTANNGKFVTLTFSNQSIKQLINLPPTKYWPGMKGMKGYALDNQIATRAIHLWRERWRKQYKHSPRHWLVTELGHNGTENIHLHGIIWTNNQMEDIERHWKYGYIWKGEQKNGIITNYVNASTVGYITKYVSKMDFVHKYYKPRILTSPGIGHNYTNTVNAKKNKFQGEHTRETYKTATGHNISMPIYWRNKIYSEEEREKLWLQRLDKQERWIMGEKVDISETETEYWKLLKWYQDKNIELGYKSGEPDENDWYKEQYENERRQLMYAERLKNAWKKTKA